jgi:hypothetical protein
MRLMVLIQTLLENETPLVEHSRRPHVQGMYKPRLRRATEPATPLDR